MTSTSTSSISTSMPSHPIFTGDNYDYWCIKMKLFLKVSELWEIVETCYEEKNKDVQYTDVELKKFSGNEMKDARALSYIINCVLDTIFPKIMNLFRKRNVETSPGGVPCVTELMGSLLAHEHKFSKNEENRSSETVFPSKQQQKSSNNKGNNQKNQAEDSLFYARQAFTSSGSKDKWLVDSGCTSHMKNDSSTFNKLDSSIKFPVRMGNRVVVKSTGKGTIVVQTKKCTKYINDVLLVLDLSESLQKLCKCTIMGLEKKEISNFPMENKSFALKWDSAAEGTHVTHSNDTWLWNRRYGHFNMHALCELQKKNMVRDFPSISLSNDQCEPCKLGKQHRTLSFGGNKYFILFIDDSTRMTWVYFMKEKSKVFNVFKKFKALVEARKIEHQLTVGFTPQQNGVSEQKNRTIMEIARCMLMEKNLPKKFRTEAVRTTLYMLNRLLTKATQDKTTIKAWFGGKPSVKHLRVFGSICYAHIPAQKKNKLDAKTEREIFLVYDSQAKGYRIFNLDTEKIMISRDVEFNKDYANDVLKKFKMQNCKSVSTPLVVNKKLFKFNGQRKVDTKEYRILVGSLLYLTATRSYLVFVVSLFSRFMIEPSDVHMGVARRVLSDFIDFKEARNCGSIHAKAEYIAACATVNQVMWLRKIFTDLRNKQGEATKVLIDNKLAIDISDNPVCFSKTKHIKIKFCALQEAQQHKEVKLVYCPLEYQLANILTKTLPKGRFEFLRLKLGMMAKSLEEC
ncbi:hypothetical protein F3Y22_tig00116944pilonHSYRG00073 [Hibiscus syriacus]|uniref:Integrase catalytic domain-containing protein n=1 Tax=Hibiscus syriacus TaxID=106335 RepID=A0A6A2WLM0_HIBSY|nr:hypothetical protein F3Y22_tig00116944pilonHSYRG00073 [Hibiscus syriacus]